MLRDRKPQYERQKSLQQRFLFVLGLVFFLLYLALGLMIIFWKDLPLNITYNGRLAFGIVLIVYSIIRFIRLLRRR
ncbi:hypothetical protein GCM10007424_24230 [Flavobacterium suaedae]|uniref:Uncharacterized protein n=1 Tax=Flavobacterium suaedae TaxID=1767027 RepID=A0ABQ1K4T8_9FLAO|nr:hypothetical protein [Flavobacterium suaedae]GGB83351.1 hypothetical protein GCM10007424_24230 [Flavobacterium suaedae]